MSVLVTKTTWELCYLTSHPSVAALYTHSMIKIIVSYMMAFCYLSSLIVISVTCCPNRSFYSIETLTTVTVVHQLFCCSYLCSQALLILGLTYIRFVHLVISHYYNCTFLLLHSSSLFTSSTV